MKVGDSVRVYENDNFFIEGKIVCINPETTMKWATIDVDWGEFISFYFDGDLKLEHRDGVWSWRPSHAGTILSKV